MPQEITVQNARQWLPARKADSNKGSYGAVLAAAGSTAYRGAAALCTEGALRSGAGLVYLASVEPVLQLALTRTPECCVCPCRTARGGGIHPQDADALRSWFCGKNNTVLLAGPGLGESAAPVCKALLHRSAPWCAAVLDADALNALAAGKLKRLPLPKNTVLTPHPGEAARLLGSSVRQVQADRPAAARALAETYGCVAVLKGSGTLIAQPDGTLQPASGWTNIFIYPGYRFKCVDALVTNFHLPESTLIMLVSALAGREHVLSAYRQAVENRYRFFSFGDAMFIH